MRETLSLSVPQNFKKRLIKIAEKKGLTVSELLREALRKYLILEEMYTLRAKVLKEGESKTGVYTDEEIFKIVS